MSWWTKKELHPKIKSKFVVVFSDVFYLPNVKSINKPSVEIETKEYRLLNHTFNYPGNAKWKPVTLKFVDMNGMGSKTEFFDTSAFLWQILNNTGYAYPKLDNSAIRSPHYTNVDTKDGKALTTSGGHHISTQIAFRDDPKTPLKEHNTWRTITTPEKSSNIANSFGAGLEGKIDKLPASPSRQRIAIYQISPGEKPVITEAWYLVNPIVKSINWGDLSYDSEELVEYELQIVYDWAVLDRTVIGDVLEVDEKPYQQFMKTLKNNKDSIKQEMKLQESIEKLKEEIEFGESAENLEQRIDSLRNVSAKLQSDQPVDLDGDGTISNEERALWKDKKGAGIEELRETIKDKLDLLEQQSIMEQEAIEEAEEYLQRKETLEKERSGVPSEHISSTYLSERSDDEDRTKYITADIVDGDQDPFDNDIAEIVVNWDEIESEGETDITEATTYTYGDAGELQTTEQRIEDLQENIKEANQVIQEHIDTYYRYDGGEGFKSVPELIVATMEDIAAEKTIKESEEEIELLKKNNK